MQIIIILTCVYLKVNKIKENKDLYKIFNLLFLFSPVNLKLGKFFNFSNILGFYIVYLVNNKYL